MDKPEDQTLKVGESAEPYDGTFVNRKPSKFYTRCQQFAEESFKCTEKLRGRSSSPARHVDLQSCQPLFDAYNKCRKDEHTKIVQKRAKSGAQVA